MSASLLKLDAEDRSALARCRVVYVNNAEHLDLLRAAGLPEDCTIRTASPALAKHVGERADRLGAEMSSREILDLLEAFERLSQAIYLALRDREPRGLALAVARTIWRCQRIVYDAILIRKDDLGQPICVPQVTGSTAFLNQTLNFAWADLLDRDPNVVSPLISVDANKLPYVEPPDSSLFNRIALNGLGSLFFRAQIAFPQLDHFRSWTGKLYCKRDPDVLKDGGLELLKAGIRTVPSRRIPPAEEQAGDGELADTVTSGVAEEISKTLEIIPIPELRKSALNLTLAEVRSTVMNYLRVFRATSEHVSVLPDMPSGFASSTIASAEDIATAASFQNRCWPVFTFSHGATRRISDNHDRNYVLHEDVASDHYFTFVDERVGGEDAIPIERCGYTVVGAPRFYKGKPWTRFLTKPKGIWYISSGLYMAGSDKLHRAMSDHTQCAFETRVMTEILGKCGKQVTVKPYPALRYLDPDPVMEAAENAGLDIFRSATDLRYEIHKPALLITSRSGSTIGYCLCQDKPMVYIEAPGRPLRADVRQDFQDAVFVFDAESETFEADLRAFLTRPMSEINALWKEKAQARRHLVDNYIAAPISDGPKKLAVRMSEMLSASR